MANARFSVRLDSDLKDWLEAEAKRQDRSAGYVVTQAVKSLKRVSDQKRQFISEALKVADAGNFVSEESMDEWVQSWEGDNNVALPSVDVSLDGK